MEILNIGSLELILILLLAFVILGPGKLNEIGHDIGSWIKKLNKNKTFRDVVQTTEEIRNYPRKIMNETILDQPFMMDENGHQYATPPESLMRNQEETEPSEAKIK
ncbi:MAG: twin-arginine translocase TatA/TatE family subunit [Anaerolineaceae bacterium]|jgi:Sec-independent protein translocase protein TatA